MTKLVVEKTGLMKIDFRGMPMIATVFWRDVLHTAQTYSIFMPI